MIINTIKLENIERCYTEMVAKYLPKGRLCLETSSGTQGELAKTDIRVSKNEVIRIFVDRDRSYIKTGKCSYGVDLVVIYAKKYTTNGRSFETLWNSKGEDIEKKVYYKISDTTYTENEDDYKKCLLLSEKRNENIHSKDMMPIDMMSKKAQILLNMVRKISGYKRINMSDITKITAHENSEAQKVYSIFFNENTKKQSVYVAHSVPNK
jgi:hypothetical protein